MRHSRFLLLAFAISYTLHALVVYGLRWAVLRSDTVTVSNDGGGDISGMSWEVEAPAPAPQQPASAPVVPNVPIKEVAPPEKEENANTAEIPVKHPQVATAPRPSGGISGTGGAAAAPPATEVQTYLLNIRKHLSDAIQVNSITGSAPLSLILKITVTRDGEVLRQEIEKSSGNPEMDTKVLEAFRSILPLPRFPANWSKEGQGPQAITVRLPIEIHPRY